MINKKLQDNIPNKTSQGEIKATNKLINKKLEDMNNFNEKINKKMQDGINEKLKDINPNEIINKKLQDDFDKSLRNINISNELRDKKLNNDFNTFINDKLEKLIHEK